MHRFKKAEFADLRLWKWEMVDEHLVRLWKPDARPVMLLELLFILMPEEQQMLGMMTVISDSLVGAQRAGLDLVVRFLMRGTGKSHAEFSLSGEHWRSSI